MDPELKGMLRPGETFSASVTVLGTSYPLPDVHAVAEESIQSLEMVPVYNRGNDQREWGTPAGVLAITRDGEGRRVVDAPVDFALVAGHLSISSERDTLYLGDVVSQRGQRSNCAHGHGHGFAGGLDASVDLEWVALPGDEHSGDPDCVKACACTTESTGDSTPGLLALVGLGCGCVGASVSASMQKPNSNVVVAGRVAGPRAANRASAKSRFACSRA